MAESLAINGIDDSPRGRLLSAAAHLFRDKGFDRTTVRDIAASVGIQSGSIFHHFKSKEDILYAVMEEVINFNTDRLRRAMAAESRPEAQLRALVRAELQSNVGDTAEAMAVLVTEWRCLSEEKQSKALELRAIYEQLWLDALNALHGQGAFRDDPFIIRRLITGMTGWVPNWFDREGSLTLDDLADIIVRRVVGEA
ncbi:TetR family transcriptional regulator [Alcanivorax sp. HI0033]|jgi:TetR/AcrR family transcriptional regulator, cholesterol catabolism regulator|uniref:TetR/AcrR family transcriptional regulator n=1 Tax=unclassified Alcanivorax TaxID=2638842 RepID=UPI0007B847C9|nr:MULTISPECIES: TetR/AcrR family transcriptional regulator [unclassified Alcanivorax]KZX77705.1 TetR family transcriptional regulator [Alcanivorax sp. HI0011]KZX83617.1 TetR family transcriptional regulator [Alcanivorax sp. HI0013]KZY19907.1 TetR family transcriptional regulator [Alcanivorax sp. HI0035]KZX66387.1 TetR family transcriptional regulator [Alcanivorax sp. HI0003]KZX67981.1 TetR family transcriptional regulator [Alcanivorax sp. HI0007]